MFGFSDPDEEFGPESLQRGTQFHHGFEKETHSVRTGSCHAVDRVEVFPRIENPDSRHQFLVVVDALEQRLVMRAKLSPEPQQCS